GAIADAVRTAVAGVGELATPSVRLVDHTADRPRKTRVLDPVQDHLGHRRLTGDAFAARLEVERGREAFEVRPARRRRLRRKPGFVVGDLAPGGFPGFPGDDRRRYDRLKAISRHGPKAFA